ncbi:MAG: hypothetical protein ACREDL_16715, partial [Bradyrhizobium sp.]
RPFPRPRHKVSAMAAFSVSGVDCVVVPLMSPSQLPLERLVENRGKHGVQLGGGSSLERFDGVELGLQGVEVFNDLRLLANAWQ